MHKSLTHSDASARPANPKVGMLEWFRPGDHDRVDQVLSDLKRLGVTTLRTGISWADWHTPEGESWYAWLFPQVARRVEMLPCFLYTPPSWGVAPKTSAPPQSSRSYADFIDLMIRRFGRHFEYVELWNEPNNLHQWDNSLDPGWTKFTEMVGAAAHWAKQCGKKTVLGGMSPIDACWLKLMGDRQLLDVIDVVGVHAFPGLADRTWAGWERLIEPVRQVLQRYQPDAEIWITETGYSTWRHDERRQLTALVDALDAPVSRVYWHSVQDLDPTLPTVAGFHADERDYHFGLKRADGSEKLLYRIWSGGGIDAVRDNYWLGKSSAHVGASQSKPVLITGGCGFIGTNLAHRVMTSGEPVLIYDNLSRPGVERNLAWLSETHGNLLQVEAADVQDRFAIRHAAAKASRVFHLAAQVAVTTSLVNAGHDFDVNARGTLNLLEGLRSLDEPPPLIFTSTNKVYGALPDVALRLTGQQYEPENEHLRSFGVDERRPLDFHSPYGCSKGAADQYVLDYARTFGLPAAVFRMSCIYGPHQFGTEDQGWVAHFLIKAIHGEPITLYGDGRQVRDILFIDDLVDAFLLASANIDQTRSQAFNIGGGPGQAISLLDLLDMIEELHGARPEIRFGAWRPGDQRYYVSDTRKMQQTVGWKQQVGVEQGVTRLYEWLQRDLIRSRRPSRSRRRRPEAESWHLRQGASTDEAAESDAGPEHAAPRALSREVL